MTARPLVVGIVMQLAALGAIAGQGRARDTLRLAELQAAATAIDPRQAQLALQRRASALRLRTIAADRLPALSSEGLAQHQSDVTTIPVRLPGVIVPLPPHDTYDAHLVAQERLFDPSLRPRESVERANLALAEARVQTTTYQLRTEVNEAFFSAALAQARAGELTTVISDLEAQLRVARARVREGTALLSEARTLEAELLRRRQDLGDVEANRSAALGVLTELTGRVTAPDDTLIVPDLAAAIAAVRDAPPLARPEYVQFARTREQLAAQERVVASQTLPHLSAFVRAGYGKPGLDVFSTDFNTYWLGGLQVQWAPWNWGSTAREREQLAVQQDVVRSEEAAFTAGLRRTSVRQLADIDRLSAALRTDDAIITLREQIERETQHRYNEAVVTAVEFVDRRNDVLAARLARVSHEIELAQARVRLLTNIGVELR
jgi:outer membrane protein TolC